MTYLVNLVLTIKKVNNFQLFVRIIISIMHSEYYLSLVVCKVIYFELSLEEQFSLRNADFSEFSAMCRF